MCSEASSADASWRPISAAAGDRAVGKIRISLKGDYPPRRMCTLVDGTTSYPCSRPLPACFLH